MFGHIILRSNLVTPIWGGPTAFQGCCIFPVWPTSVSNREKDFATIYPALLYPRIGWYTESHVLAIAKLYGALDLILGKGRWSPCLPQQKRVSPEVGYTTLLWIVEMTRRVMKNTSYTHTYTHMWHDDMCIYIYIYWKYLEICIHLLIHFYFYIYLWFTYLLHTHTQ